MQAVTRKLAQFVAETRYEDLPSDVVRQVKMCVLDYIGCALGGSAEKDIEILANFVKKIGGAKEATVIGYSIKTPALSAGLVNGAMGHALQMDDGDRFTLAHLGTEIIPAALALGERERCDGKEVITAIALGYEAAMRIGYAVNPSHHNRGFCPNSTLGVFGATVAASKILKLSWGRTAEALGSAGTQASGLEEFVIDGSASQFLNPGHATLSGILSALLAKEKFSGARTILEGPRGFCKAFSDKYDISIIIDKLGEEYQIMKVYFKPYPTCRCMHSSIDAIVKLVKEYAIQARDIEEVQVKTYSYNIDLMCGPQPRTIAHARLHMPYCLACSLVEGRLTVKELANEKLRDARILALMKKIKFTIADDELNQFAPHLWGTIITMVTRDGNRYEERVSLPKGEPENPMSEKELKEKFEALASLVGIKKEKINEIVAVISRLEKIDDIAELVNLLYAERLG